MNAATTTPRLLAAVLALLTIFGPISMDLYLPVLPTLTDDLGAATSVAQLTITACLLGLAFGQVVAGPLSDRFGRRRPLLVGLVAYIVTSIACAASPTVEVLVGARFIQGLAGAVGIVIAQAAGRDIYSGGQLARYYGRLTVLGGLAAIVGPVIGGQLANFTDWRGIFVFLAGVGVLILLAVLVIFRETLPSEQRIDGGLAPTLRGFGVLLRDRVFLGAVLVTGFVYAALFAYLSGATFVLQGIYGLSPQEYALAFGLNSLGFMVFGFAAGRTTEKWSATGTLQVGLIMCLAGAFGLLATAALHLPLIAIVASLVTMVSGVAVTTPPATTLALTNYPHMAGTASSLLGLARFAFGGVSAPLIGIAGAGTALPLGIVTVASMALAVGAYAVCVSASSPKTRTISFAGSGLRDEVALDVVAPELAQPLELLLGLDALRDHQQPQRLRHGQHRRDDRVVLRPAPPDAGDERAVDLEGVDRESLEPVQRRGARPEVVEVQLDADRGELVEDRGRGVHGAHEDRLGDLQGQQVRRRHHAGALEDGGHARGEPGQDELHTGDVDRDADVGRDRALGAPLHQLPARLLHDELAERDDQPGALGHGDELVGRDQAALGMLPAHERLHADQAPVRGADERLVVDAQLPLGDGLAQLGLDAQLVASPLEHGAVEADVLAGPALLGAVHRDVGVAQHRLGPAPAVPDAPAPC